MGSYKKIGGIDFDMDDNGVFCSKARLDFDYSDGREVEVYLEKAFRESSDLSSESYELESRSKDWPTEYHLTRKRAQLLKGFDFNPHARVLEVGCGCGAISRLLGETFDEVISVEGSYNRAKLARLRCKELANVSVVCSPYQDLVFDNEFDFVFCIGVLEYAGYLVGGDDPYALAIASFSKALRPDGVLVVAIENQYGLKYFSKASEDHTNRMFEGVEGYPVYKDIVKTFGRDDLRKRLRKHFSRVEFFYPYPDYKIPDCVLSECFLRDAKPAELIGGISSRDYVFERNELFSEKLAYGDLAVNEQLQFFSNSFLVFAGAGELPALRDAEGVLYSSGRLPQYSTVTWFRRDDHANFVALKKERYPLAKKKTSATFKLNPYQCPWYEGKSIHGQIIDEILKKNIAWEKISKLVLLWVDGLERESLPVGGRMTLPGRFLDATWKNCFIDQEVAKFVDLEWAYSKEIDVRLIFLRSIGILINDLIEIRAGRKVLSKVSTKMIIHRLAETASIEIDSRSVKNYVVFEESLNKFVTGKGGCLSKITITYMLWSPNLVWFGKRAFKYLRLLTAFNKRVLRFLRKKFIN